MASGPVTNFNTAQSPSKSVSKLRGFNSKKDNSLYRVELNVIGAEADKINKAAGKAIFPMIGFMGEKYQIDFGSSWTAPFGKAGMGDAVGGVLAVLSKGKVSAAGAGGAVDSIASMLGVSSRLKAQSAQVWEGSDPLKLSFEFQFAALDNTNDDVTRKVVALLKLCAPSEQAGSGGQVLIAPGPIVASKVAGAIGLDFSPRRITLKVGNFLFLDNIIINSVSSAISGLADRQGMPIAASVAVAISSYYSSFTAEDIDKAFAPALGNSAGPQT